MFEVACDLLAREATGMAFRLIGLGASPLLPLAGADHGDLADFQTPKRAAAQAAIDALRQRYGVAAISRGRGWEGAEVASPSPPPNPLPRGEGE
jgi:DNA polymerase-4